MATNAPQPFGLQPVDTILSNNYSGQLATFLIKSGYAQNLFQGDPVVLAGAADKANAYTGYIISLYDIPAANRTTTPILGIFQGCTYVQPSNFNGIDPAYNGRSYWAANTQTLNNVPAVAQIVLDPNVVYQVLCNSATPFTQNLIGQCADIAFDATAVDNGLVNGSVQSGQSKVGISLPVAGKLATSNVYAMGVQPAFPNITSPSAIQPTGAYPILNVILQNHQLTVRNAPRT